MFYKVIQCQILMDSTDRNNSPNRKRMFQSSLNGRSVIHEMMPLWWLGQSPKDRKIAYDLISRLFSPGSGLPYGPQGMKATKMGASQDISRKNNDLAAECLWDQQCVWKTRQGRAPWENHRAIEAVMSLNCNQSACIFAGLWFHPVKTNTEIWGSQTYLPSLEEAGLGSGRYSPRVGESCRPWSQPLNSSVLLTVWLWPM